MSVGYGTGIASPGGTFISFSGTGGNRTYQHTGNNALVQANWANNAASPISATSQSPGYPNSCTNATWIEAMRSVEDYDVVDMQAYCSDITFLDYTPASCASTSYLDFSPGCTADSYAWFSSDPLVVTISAMGPTPTINQLTNGTSTITGTITKTHSVLFAGPNTTVGCAATPKVITLTQDIVVSDCGGCPAISAVISGEGGFCGEGNTEDADMPLIVTITGGTGPYTVVYEDEDDMNPPYAPITGYNSGEPISQTIMSTTEFTLVSVMDANGCVATLSGLAKFFVSEDPPAATDC